MSGPGIPFGDPRHPWRQTTESARKAARANRGKTPWRKFRLPGSPPPRDQQKP